MEPNLAEKIVDLESDVKMHETGGEGNRMGTVFMWKEYEFSQLEDRDRLFPQS